MRNFLMFLPLLFFISCDTSDNSTTQVDTVKLDKEFRTINSGYNSHEQQRTFKQWCQIGVADVGGAWAGSWAGGQIGGYFGPQGAATGAVVGAVVVGAAASYGASRFAPESDQSLIDTKISRYDVSTTFTNPNNNPFDIIVGKRHNEIVKELVQTNPADGPSDVQTLYNNVPLASDERLFYSYEQGITLDFYDQLKRSNSYQNQKDLLSRYINDNALLVVMNNYIDGVSTTANFNDAIQLSQDYEAHVISNSQLTAEQKNTLLRGFSVARYSLNFWYQVN